MQVLRRGGMLLVGMIGLALFVGGCSKNKQADLTAQENAELREKIAALEEANRQAAVRDAERNQMTDNGGWEPEPAPRNVRGGGTPVFTDNEQGQPQATIAGDVLFASGSATIKADARKTLDRVATEIKRDYAGATVRVEGYTDSDPLVKTKKQWGTNEKLSQARANAVKTYLANKGIKSSRIEAMGFGSAKPKATKAQSRRVEIIIEQ
ncbi:MAG TPA: OmpA family protein [Phycisphaerales bacterium]|nr:OmpA family protein [Phycisphaerales bacterium]